MPLVETRGYNIVRADGPFKRGVASDNIVAMDFNPLTVGSMHIIDK